MRRRERPRRRWTLDEQQEHVVVRRPSMGQVACRLHLAPAASQAESTSWRAYWTANKPSRRPAARASAGTCWRLG